MKVVEVPRTRFIQLRLAEMADAPLLLKWRNDPVTRANSRHQGVIEPRAHQEWLAESLATRSRRMYIALLYGAVPVGTGRIDYSTYDAEFSLTVAPEHRNRGYARWLIKALCDEAAPRGVPQIAEVLTTNTPSIIAFLRNGFEAQEVRDENRILVEGGHDGRRWLYLRKAISA